MLPGSPETSHHQNNSSSSFIIPQYLTSRLYSTWIKDIQTAKSIPFKIHKPHPFSVLPHISKMVNAAKPDQQSMPMFNPAMGMLDITMNHHMCDSANHDDYWVIPIEFNRTSPWAYSKRRCCGFLCVLWAPILCRWWHRGSHILFPLLPHIHHHHHSVVPLPQTIWKVRSREWG